MAYTNPRGQSLTDIGITLTTLCACTLADYTTGGTQTPLVDDLVTFSATGDWYAKRAGDDLAGPYGRVTKIEVAPVGTALGYIAVEWLDVSRFVACDCAVLANATRGNRAMKVGSDTAAHDWDAPDKTGSNLLVVAKSAATGVGSFLAAVLAFDGQPLIVGITPVTLATGADQELCFTAPAAGVLTAVTITGKDALATDDTNYQAFTLTNKGQAGAGTTVMLSAAAGGATTKTTGGQALVAYGFCALPLSATAANLVVAKNDTLAFKVTHNGTPANTVTEPHVRFEFLPTGN